MPKTILDVGAYNGISSKGFVKDGDTWILLDNEQYKQYDGWGKTDAPSLDVPNITVRYVIGDVMDYNEPADLVVCQNVLYHVPDPQAFLKKLYDLTKKTMVLTTYFDNNGEGWHNHYKDIKWHPHAPTAETIYFVPSVETLRGDVAKLGWARMEVVIHGSLVTLTCGKEIK